MAQIDKHTIPATGESFELRIAGFQDIVHVGEDGQGFPCIWAQVNPNQPEESWTFMLVATGQEFDADKWCHVRSFVQANAVVWHLLRPFESTMPSEARSSSLVYVVATKRSDDRLPGLEKACEHRMYFTYDEAEAARQLLPETIRDSFGVFSVYCIVQQKVTFEVPF